MASTLKCGYCSAKLSEESKAVSINPPVEDRNHLMGDWLSKGMNRVIKSLKECNDGEYFSLEYTLRGDNVSKCICAKCFYKKSRAAEQKQAENMANYQPRSTANSANKYSQQNTKMTPAEYVTKVQQNEQALAQVGTFSPLVSVLSGQSSMNNQATHVELVKTSSQLEVRSDLQDPATNINVALALSSQEQRSSDNSRTELTTVDKPMSKAADSEGKSNSKDGQTSINVTPEAVAKSTPVSSTENAKDITHGTASDPDSSVAVKIKRGFASFREKVTTSNIRGNLTRVKNALTRHKHNLSHDQPSRQKPEVTGGASVSTNTTSTQEISSNGHPSDGTDPQVSKPKSETEKQLSEAEEKEFERQKVFQFVASLESTDPLAADRQWLTNVQTYLVNQYSQIHNLDELRVQFLLNTLITITANASMEEYFEFTKVLSTFGAAKQLSFSTDFYIDFFLGLLQVYNSKTHLHNTKDSCLINCLKLVFKHQTGDKASDFHDVDLSDMVASFSPAEIWFVCSLFSVPRGAVDVKELEELMTLIQTYQIPMTEVNKHVSISQGDVNLKQAIQELRTYVDGRQANSLEDVCNKLKESKLLSSDMLETIKQCVMSMKTCSDVDIDQTKAALSSIASSEGAALVDNIATILSNVSSAICLTIEDIARVQTPQLVSLCVLLLSHKHGDNKILEVLTGEGKSCIIAMFAACLALIGKRVDIVTSSKVLAVRDAEKWEPFFKKMGVSVACNVENSELLSLPRSFADKKRAQIYQKTVVYGTVASFSADILRQEFEGREIRGDRGLQAAIVDEVDMLMLDEGVQFTYLSHRDAILRHLEPVLGMMWAAVKVNTPVLTKDGEILFAGTPVYIHDAVLSENSTLACLQQLLTIETEMPGELVSKINIILAADELKAQQNAIKTLTTQDMLTIINALNASQLANVTAFTLNEEGILNEVSKKAPKIPESSDPVPVLLKDQGLLLPLHSYTELSNGIQGLIMNECDLVYQRDHYKTTDGTLYYTGDAEQPDTFVGKWLDPLRTLTKLGGVREEITKAVFEARKKEQREEVIETFKIQDLLSLIDHLNESGVANAHILVYTLNKEGTLSVSGQKDGLSESKQKKAVKFLALDNGKMQHLWPPSCFDSWDKALFTTEGERMIPGGARGFDEMLAPYIDPFLTLNKLSSTFQSKPAGLDTSLSAIKTINQLSLAMGGCTIVAYTTTKERNLEHIEPSEHTMKDRCIRVFLQYNGMIRRLYTPPEMNAGQEEMLSTTDGRQYHRGNVYTMNDLMTQFIGPQQILHLMVENNIAPEKTQNLLKAKDKEAQDKAMEAFTVENVSRIIKFLELNLFCNFAAYKLDGLEKLVPIAIEDSLALGGIMATFDKVIHSVVEESVPFAVLEHGQISFLYLTTEEEKQAVTTPDGIHYIFGKKEPFYSAIVKAVDPTKLMEYLKTQNAFEDSLLSVLEGPTSENDVLKSIPHWEEFSRFNAEVYDIKGETVYPTIKDKVAKRGVDILEEMVAIKNTQGKWNKFIKETAAELSSLTTETTSLETHSKTASDEARLLIATIGLAVMKTSLPGDWVGMRDLTNVIQEALPIDAKKLTDYTLISEQQKAPKKKKDGRQEKEKMPFLLENGKVYRLQLKERITVPAFLKNFTASQLATYIDSALTAHLLTENREYLISQDGKIVPVDFQNSGIIEENKKWGGGLQQMLEMKHHLQLSPLAVITNFKSHIGFFRQYECLYGLSGTIGCEAECEVLQELYKFTPCRIPTNKQRLLYEREPIVVEGEREKWLERIHFSIIERTSPKEFPTSKQQGASVLVLCEDIRTANEIDEYLKKNKVSSILYTRNDIDFFSENVERSSGNVIIATNLASRGTDIKVTREVNQSAGLFCLMTFLPRNRRVELQAFGRTARCGNPGSVQYILPAAALPGNDTARVDMEGLRRYREESEARRLRDMMENDIKQVELRERLFTKHCEFLGGHPNFRKEDAHSKTLIDSVNECWGRWLQTKQLKIEHREEEDLMTELGQVQVDWMQPTKSVLSTSKLVLSLPAKHNFYDLIRHGNHCLFNRYSQPCKKHAEQAMQLYTQAVDMQHQYTTLAYYNRACSRLTIGEGEHYIQLSIDDLNKAKDLMQVYTREVTLVHQSAMSGGRRKDSDNPLVHQMQVRLELLQHFQEKIQQAVEKLKDIQKKEKTPVVYATSILQFIPEADMVTNEELYSLKLLGLEVSFTVKEKTSSSFWAALAVFLLGVLEIVAGVCITALSAGALSSLGTGLISEGISDCIDGAMGMITGEFDAAGWAISKAASIVLSVVCGGVGRLIANGAKAAVEAGKEAKSVLGGVKSVANSVKATIEEGASVIKADIKAMSHEAGKVMKGELSHTFKNNLWTGVKYAGKKMASQVALYVLNQLESKVIEKIFEKVGHKFAGLLSPDIQDSFNSSAPEKLGRIVDHRFNSTQNLSYRTIIAQEFSAVANDTVQSLSSNNDSILDKAVSTFRDQVLPELSKHCKGGVIGMVAELMQAEFVLDSIEETAKDISCLAKEFRPAMARICRTRFSGLDESLDYASVDGRSDVQALKQDLAKQTTDTIGGAIAVVLQQRLSWAINGVLNKHVNDVVAEHLDHHLKTEKTLKEISSAQKATYIRSVPPDTPRHVADEKQRRQHKEAMHARAEAVIDPHTVGNIAHLKVLSEKEDIKFTVRNSKKELVCSIQSTSDRKDKPEIVLIHTPKDERPPNGHYDLMINGEVVPITSTGNSCMHEAVAKGMEHLGLKEGEVSASDVRQAIHDELIENPEKWLEHFERSEQLKGTHHLLEGAGIECSFDPDTLKFTVKGRPSKWEDSTKYYLVYDWNRDESNQAGARKDLGRYDPLTRLPAGLDRCHRLSYETIRRILVDGPNQAQKIRELREALLPHQDEVHNTSDPYLADFKWAFEKGGPLEPGTTDYENQIRDIANVADKLENGEHIEDKEVKDMVEYFYNAPYNVSLGHSSTNRSIGEHMDYNPGTPRSERLLRLYRPTLEHLGHMPLEQPKGYFVTSFWSGELTTKWLDKVVKPTGQEMDGPARTKPKRN